MVTCHFLTLNMHWTVKMSQIFIAVKFYFFLKTLNIKVLYELIILGIEIAYIRVKKKF